MVYRLEARYEADDETVFELRSRRPQTSPRSTDLAVIDRILQLRIRPTAARAGAWPVTRHHQLVASRAKIRGNRRSP